MTDMTQAPTPGPLSVLAFHCESARLIPLLRKEAERLGKDIPTDRPGLHKDIWTAAEIIEQAESAFAFSQKMDALAPTAPVEASGSEPDWKRRLSEVHAGGQVGDVYAEFPSPKSTFQGDLGHALSALRFQPSGETRDAGWISDEDMRDLLECRDVGAGRAKLQLILNALSARPLALGGQQGERVDRYYEALVQADLKIRSLPGTDQSDVEFIRDALSTTPARAEAQDEGAAGEPVAWSFELATAFNKATGEYSNWGNPRVTFSKPCVTEDSIRNLTPLYAHPSPPPAAEPRKVSAFPVDGDPVQQMTGLTVADALDDPVSSLGIMRALTTSRTLCVWADGTYRVIPTMDVPTARDEEGTLIGVIPLAEVGEIAPPAADEDRVQWMHPDAVPQVKAGREEYRIVAVQRAHDGNIYRFPATYLNQVPLTFEDEGYTPRPVTGWFSAVTSEDGDGSLYHELLSDGDELKAWCDLPPVPTAEALAALKSTAAKEGEKS